MAKTHNTTTAPTGQIAPFGLRMLPELREKIEQAARESGRSMNAEIVARLQATFDETVVTTVEARAKPGEGEQFEFNADAIADKVMERLEGKAGSRPIVIVGNLGRDPEERAFSKEIFQHYIDALAGKPLSELKPRGNEPYGPAKSPNARRAKKT